MFAGFPRSSVRVPDALRVPPEEVAESCLSLMEASVASMFAVISLMAGTDELLKVIAPPSREMFPRIFGLAGVPVTVALEMRVPLSSRSEGTRAVKRERSRRGRSSFTDRGSLRKTSGFSAHAEGRNGMVARRMAGAKSGAVASPLRVRVPALDLSWSLRSAGGSCEVAGFEGGLDLGICE
jgi:hypothetical protein